MACKVLITGFEGYGGRGRNPSSEVARALNGLRSGDITLVGETMPVSYARLQGMVADLLERHRPAIYLALGLWPGEAVIRLERLASNFADFEIADNEGALHRCLIVPDGPVALATSLPLHAMRDRLLKEGIPARLSSTPGNFLCNATFYHALREAAKHTEGPACGFIHVPYLPEQVAELIRMGEEEARLELHQRADLASMALDLQIAAIRLAVETACGVGR